eukprot:SAG31_NODE_6002_length_2218_cov_1.772534_1_plen_192_part_00
MFFFLAISYAQAGFSNSSNGDSELRNAKKETLPATERNGMLPQPYLVATRRIAPGTEILWDYVVHPPPLPQSGAATGSLVTAPGTTTVAAVAELEAAAPNPQRLVSASGDVAAAAAESGGVAALAPRSQSMVEVVSQMTVALENRVAAAEARAAAEAQLRAAAEARAAAVEAELEEFKAPLRGLKRLFERL